MSRPEAEVGATRLEQLFHRARPMPREERATFLERECRDAPELLAEVTALLKQDDQGTKEYLLSPVQDRVHASDTGKIAAPATTFPGRTPRYVGDYRILARIGEGGMGRVYLALREADGRRVALKIVRVAGVSHALPRFEKEREALEAMRHENICSVLDSGVTEEGLPYFVMEFVDGARTVTDFVEAEQLDLGERLRLFLKICDAVGHGHGRGFLHRDLKPSNVLVGTDGEPKLIDFGIARSLVEGASFSDLTESGQLLGTLQYMSPEQLELKERLLDVRSDVYSLGILLYELVTGRLPYEVGELSLVQAARVIREQPPMRASATNPGLRGDLETILEKALEKEPDRRYLTARDLSLDVERYLRSQPIAARPPSLAYQGRLFARRHPRLVVGGVSAALLLCLCSIFAVLWARREESARREAEAITDFLATSLGGVDPLRAPTVPLLLERMERRLAANPARPATHGRILALIGRAYGSLGDYAAGEARLRRAVDLLTEAVGPSDPRTLHARLSLFMQYEDESPATEARLLGLIAELEQVLGDVHEDTLEARRVLASLRLEQGRFEESEELFRGVIAGYTELGGELGFDTLGARAALAGLYQTWGRVGEAERLYEEVVAQQVEVYGRAVPSTLNGLALVRIDQARYDEAERLLLDVIEFEEEHFGAWHPWTLLGKYNLGDLYLDRGRRDEAEALLAETYDGQLEVLGPSSAETIATQNALARIALSRGDAQTAEPLLRDAVERIRALGGRHLELGIYLTDHGVCLRGLDRHAEARAVLTEAHELLARILGPGANEPLAARVELVRVLEQLGEHDAAEGLRQR